MAKQKKKGTKLTISRLIKRKKSEKILYSRSLQQESEIQGVISSIIHAAKNLLICNGNIGINKSDPVFVFKLLRDH